MLFLLASMYTHVHIVKPNTSRAANSERYVVCTGYKLTADAIMKNAFADIIAEMNPTLFIRSLLSVKIPLYFYSKIEEVNVVFGQNQLDNIYTTLSLIETRAKKDKIDHYVRQNIQKCIQWCIRHNFDYNEPAPDNTGANIFSQKKYI